MLFAPRELPPLPPDVAHDRGEYSEWVRLRENERSRRTKTLHPALALLMVAVAPSADLLGTTLRSLEQQSSRRWRLTIATPVPGDVENIVGACLRRGTRRRVRTVGTRPGTPMVDLVRHASEGLGGAGVALVFPGDSWAPDTVALLGAAAMPQSVVYADEDELTGAGVYRRPRLKPDFSPDFLRSSAYMGRPIAFGSKVAATLPDSVAHDSPSMEHECALAATETTAASVVHISEVLCHRTDTGGTDADAVPVTISRILPVEGPPASVPVSILVPFRDEPGFLRTCVDSVTTTTKGHDVELLLIDNGSTDLEVLTLLDRLQTRPDVRIISDPRPFNWAELNNAAAGVAVGEVLIFLNNDIEARRDGWLEALIRNALRPDVGAVGARLLYPDGRLQHCGVVVGLIGAAGHPLLGLAPGEPGYLNMALARRECAAVTGACLASRRDVFDRLGGFDETLGVDLNDIDYCLRAGALGLRTIYEPAAELIHHESPSRGTAGGVDDIINFIDRWKEYIARGDPYLNPHLSRSSVGCELASSAERDRWNQWYSTLVAR